MKLASQWENLARREQILIAVGTAFIVLLLVYNFILSPFWNALDQLKQNITSTQQQLKLMQAAGMRIQQLKASGYQVPTGTIALSTDAIKMSLTQSKLDGFVKQLTAQNSNIILKMDAVPFDNFMDWLEGLWQNSMIKVERMQVNALKVPGLVDVSVELNRVATP